MASEDDAALARRVLKGPLREARMAAGLTREQVVEDLGWSLSKLVRIETGEQGVSATDLRAMLALYGVTGKNRIQELAQLARGSRQPVWWAAYRPFITKAFGQFLSFESAASDIRTFHPLLVPGVLHTREYAQALLRLTKPDDIVTKLVELRMLRQERLFKQLEEDGGPKATFIFGEEALNRYIGSPEVMSKQFSSLLKVATIPAVSVQVIPVEAGGHPGLSGPFILLGLQETGESLLFLESAGGDFASRDEQEMIYDFIDNFEKLRQLALSKDKTSELISQRLEVLSTSKLHHNAD
jgi:transcriptional regulator with XRE-family HTH domain